MKNVRKLGAGARFGRPEMTAEDKKKEVIVRDIQTKIQMSETAGRDFTYDNLIDAFRDENKTIKLDNVIDVLVDTNALSYLTEAEVHPEKRLAGFLAKVGLNDEVHKKMYVDLSNNRQQAQEDALIKQVTVTINRGVHFYPDLKVSIGSNYSQSQYLSGCFKNVVNDENMNIQPKNIVKILVDSNAFAKYYVKESETEQVLDDILKRVGVDAKEIPKYVEQYNALVSNNIEVVKEVQESKTAPITPEPIMSDAAVVVAKAPQSLGFFGKITNLFSSIALSAPEKPKQAVSQVPIVEVSAVSDASNKISSMQSKAQATAEKFATKALEASPKVDVIEADLDNLSKQAAVFKPKLAAKRSK